MVQKHPTIAIQLQTLVTPQAGRAWVTTVVRRANQATSIQAGSANIAFLMMVVPSFLQSLVFSARAQLIRLPPLQTVTTLLERTAAIATAGTLKLSNNANLAMLLKSLAHLMPHRRTTRTQKSDRISIDLIAKDFSTAHDLLHDISQGVLAIGFRWSPFQGEAVA